MIAPVYALGLPAPTCEGRELTKRDVGRWVVRTRPSNAGSDWSFTVRGSTIEEWKRQVVKVIAIKRAQVYVEDRGGKTYVLDDEMSNDTGWLTLEEFRTRKVSYVNLPYSTFIKETKWLEASDVGKKFVRVANNGALDVNFILPEFTLSQIDLFAVEVLAYKYNKITISFDGRKIELKDDYALAAGWVEVNAFKEAIKKQGIIL